MRYDGDYFLVVVAIIAMIVCIGIVSSCEQNELLIKEGYYPCEKGWCSK